MHRPSIATIEREKRAVELRKAGLDYRTIASQLGLKSASSAHQIVQRALQRTLREAGTEQVRDFEGDRLDRLQTAVWGRAMQGDIPAVNAVLRIMERRARLFGLDAPVVVQATVETFDGTTLDEAVSRLANLARSQKVIATTGKEVQDGESSETGARQLGMASSQASRPVRSGEVRRVGDSDVDELQPVRDDHRFGDSEVVATGGN